MAKQHPAPAHCWNWQTHAVQDCEEQNMCNGGGKVANCEEGYHEDRLRQRGTFSRLPSAAYKTNFSASLVKKKQFGGLPFPTRARPSSPHVILLIRLHPSSNLVLVIEFNFCHSYLWPPGFPADDGEHKAMNPTWWNQDEQLLVTIVAFDSVKLFLKSTIRWVHCDWCCLFPHLKCRVARVWKQIWWLQNAYDVALCPIDVELDGRVSAKSEVIFRLYLQLTEYSAQNVGPSRKTRKYILFSNSVVLRKTYCRESGLLFQSREIGRARAETLSSTGTAGYFEAPR